MGLFLAKRIGTAKWLGRANIGRNAIPADAVVTDLKTENNTLSFWLYDSTQPGSLEEVAVAIAATRNTVQRLDLVWVKQKQIRLMGLKLDATEGRTPVAHLRDRHVDVVGIDLDRLCRLARSFVRSISTRKQTRIFREKEVQKLLVDALNNKTVAIEDLDTQLASKLRPLITS